MKETPISRQESCLDSIRQRAQQNRFLGTVDQSPILEQLLSELEAVLKHDESDALERLIDITRNAAQRVSSLSASLLELRAPLEQAFSELQRNPESSELGPAIKTLTTAGETLARRLRYPLLHLLDEAAPSHRLIPNMLESIQAGRKAAVQSLPESLWLLLTRRPQVEPCIGTSLAAKFISTQLAALCATPWRARWRLRTERNRLRSQYQLVEIDPREILVNTLLQHTEIKSAALIQRHADTHATFDAQLNDAWRALRYSLDTAIVEFQDMERTGKIEAETLINKSNELAKLVMDALAKAESAMQDSVTIYATVFEGMLAEITQDRTYALGAARKIIAGAGRPLAKIQFTANSLRKNLRRRVYQIWHISGSQLTIAQHLLKRARQRSEQLWLQLKDRLGLGQLPEGKALAIADLPETRELAERLQSLPPAYRRLFSADPLLNREFLVGRNDQLEILTRAFRRWREGRATNIAIVGNEGSGKSSLLNCFEHEIVADTEILHINLNQRLQSTEEFIGMFAAGLGLDTIPTSVDELVQVLLDGPRRVVVVRRMHNMYLRRLGSSEAPRALFQLMLATRSHLLWLTSFRYYPWKRLVYLFEAARYYTHVLETEVHDEGELRETILRRQRTTGDSLLFSDYQLNVRAIRKLRLTHELNSAPVQKALADYYFANLLKLSGGNIEAAFYFWLLSLRAEQAGEILVRPNLRLDDRLIRGLDRMDQFTLAELMGHGHLTADEHAVIFRCDILLSRLVLDNLMQLRIVDRRDSDQNGQAKRYGVSTVFQQAVTTVLTDKNILY